MKVSDPIQFVHVSGVTGATPAVVVAVDAQDNPTVVLELTGNGNKVRSCPFWDGTGSPPAVDYSRAAQ